MRSPSPLVVRAAKSTAVLALAPVLWCGPAAHALPHAAAAEPGSVPSCGRRGSSEFPIDARLYGGPKRYPPGGGWRAWHLELRNTTRAECRAIHPIAILVDRGRALRPGHIRMEFLDPYGENPDGGTWRPVSFETTDEHENIGVFGDPFPGFTVPARGRVEVAVRTRFTDSAPTGPVTANVITMQRRADDGDWVGQSDDYDFRVERAGEAGTDPDERADGNAAAGDGRVTGETGTPRTEGTSTGEPPTSAPSPDGTGREARPESPGGSGKEAAARGEDGDQEVMPPALAATGRDAVLLGLAAVSGALVLTGAALVAMSRRLRR
ncbi:hypothetical protein [Streptomyces cuspidosporus]|uniref:Gram-positive cocci surface proteins LPxTG domain-containing protein n=1 Tax=Streptomyces cuspidosporus TaxID=66882 RepID=A0ABN3H1Y3_9ACTN